MDFKIPSMTEVEAKMAHVLSEPAKVDLDIPDRLLNLSRWKEDMYEYQPRHHGAKGPPLLNEKYEMPGFWSLRPKGYDSMESVLKAICEIPFADGRTFWQGCNWDEVYPKPQVVGDNPPFRTFYLKPDKEDSVIVNGKIAGPAATDDFKFLDRDISPLSEDAWKISPSHPMFEWKFLRVPANPTIEWILEGHIYEDDSFDLGLSYHPETTAHYDYNLPPWRRPLCLGYSIFSEAVYGTAWLGLKQLGFWGGLEVAINLIRGFEWAYDVADKPEYLSNDTPSSNDEASADVQTETDPVFDAVATIKQRNDPAEFTKSGKPYVRVTSKLAGQKVSGKARDDAWKKVQV